MIHRPYEMYIVHDVIITCDLSLCLILCYYCYCLKYSKTNIYWCYQWLLKIISLKLEIFPSTFGLGYISNFRKIIFNSQLTASNYLYNRTYLESAVCSSRRQVARNPSQLGQCKSSLDVDTYQCWWSSRSVHRRNELSFFHLKTEISTTFKCWTWKSLPSLLTLHCNMSDISGTAVYNTTCRKYPIVCL